MAVGTVSALEPNQWQLVSTTTISSSTASVTVSSLSGYKTYMIIGRGMTATGGTMSCRPNNDSTTGNYFNDSTYLSMGAAMSSTTPEGSFITIYNANESVPHLAENGLTGTTTYYPQMWLSATPITSFVFITSTGGSFMGGTIEIYGIAA